MSGRAGPTLAFEIRRYRPDQETTKAAISGGLASSAMNFYQLFSLLARFHDMNSPIVEPAPEDDELAAGAL